MIFKKAMFSKMFLIRRATPTSVTRKLLWSAVTILPLLWSQLAFGSALSNLAASLQPGTWAQITTSNIVPILASETGASGVMLHYAMTGNWNPNEGKAYFFGGDHHGGLPGYGARLVWYDEASNTWMRSAVQPSGTAEPSTVVDPVTGGAVGVHGYDLWSIDVANQYMYWKTYASPSGPMRFTRSPMPVTPTSFVALTPNFTGVQYDAQFVGTEYWPGKGFVVFDCNSAGGQLVIRSDAGSYTSIQNKFTTAPYHCAAVYSPVHNVMIFGGGNNNTQSDSRIVWRLNSDNTYTRLIDTPFTDGWGIQRYNAALDPVTGNFIFVGSGQIWELDPRGNGSWRQLNGSAVPPGLVNPVGGANGVISIPVSSHGVIMYVSCLVGNCTVYVYKHAAGTSTPPSTAAPTVNLSVNPATVASGGASTLTWNSTNSTSCSASGGWSGAKAVSDSQSTGNLTATTTFSLTCNGTGGSATQSATVTVTTSSFDFSLSNGGNQTVTQGQSISNNVATALLSGSAQSVTFSTSGLPSGATGSYSPASCTPACSTSVNISTASSTPAGSYPVTVTASGGGTTRTTSFTLTVAVTTPPSTPPLSVSVSADYQARCGAPGVVRCYRFDTPTDLGGENLGLNYGHFNNNGIGTCTAVNCPTIDVAVPNGPAMKFTIPSNSGAGGSGQWYGNFSKDLLTQFGSNQVFYLQWQQRFSPCFLFAGADDAACAAAGLANPGAVRIYQILGGNAGGWKLLGVSEGDIPPCSPSNPSGCASACTANDIVVQNTSQRGFAQMYRSCAGSTHQPPYAPFEPIVTPPGDILFQSARPSPYCTYSQGRTSPKTFFPPNGNCFGFFPNEWLTFKVKITLGACTAPLDEWGNSNVQLWIGREGQASVKVIDATDYITSGFPCDTHKIGKAWLLPYHTYKDSAEVHPTGYTWYKELIISTQDIADPTASSSSASIPTAPSGLAIK